MHPVPLTSIYTKIEENNFDISNNYKQLHSFYCLGDYIGNDSNLLIVFYVQIMPDDLVMQLHRF